LETDRLPAGSTVPVESSFGYPYGHLTVEAGKSLPANRARSVRDRWHLCLATEIAGTARAALDEMVAHLRHRYQFGRRLADFQALRHRSAEWAVTTEAAKWLAREAAWYLASPGQPGGVDGGDRGSGDASGPR